LWYSPNADCLGVVPNEEDFNLYPHHNIGLRQDTAFKAISIEVIERTHRKDLQLAHVGLDEKMMEFFQYNQLLLQ
jgi:hypothetical protein